MAIALLFWNSLYAATFVVVVSIYIICTSGVFGIAWKALRSPRDMSKPSVLLEQPTAEPTLAIQVLGAPQELLDVDSRAGTSTIMNAFFGKVKAERSDDLRLSKQGRRITAAKNEMMARRRKSKKAESELHCLLASRPLYSGKVVQFKNLSDSALKKYEVGKEIEGIAGISLEADKSSCKGYGRHRLVFHSWTGRLMNESGEVQVAFLPSTRFLVISLERWQNPDDPESPEGYTIELKEVA